MVFVGGLTFYVFIKRACHIHKVCLLLLMNYCMYTETDNDTASFAVFLSADYN